MSAAALAIGVGAFQLFSGLQQSNDILEQAKLSRRIGQLNAKNFELEAFEAEKFGFTESARYKSVIDKTIGSQKAILASQGVNVHTGTAAVIQAESKLTGFLNQLDIQQAGRNKAKGLRFQASASRMGQSFDQAQAAANASAARVSGVANASSTYLGYKLRS